ncbi:ribonuclease M5 [Spiroplasma culicicola]|uniref:Ribonuclease M5 n=1 Tax=Spiroplasma culicicola AES-1 TaxID=1276246 RepID=W6AI65_9MOLU|nr:ribonuclease M5 [Spiroplasma culicicola]AHI53399.1 primase-like protein [Spiroplasma culicicola AES-1]
MKIEQVIIVEGKTDTNKLKLIYGSDNIDTIETNGLALDNKILQLIRDLNDVRGVIIFTDPDGPGVKIRDTINAYLNFKCFNAFINKKSIKNSKKIGIAEANEEDIREALKNLIQFNGKEIETLTWKQYLENDFYNIKNRIKIASHFNWNEKINSKKLFQWLNLLNLNVEDVKKILGVS